MSQGHQNGGWMNEDQREAGRSLAVEAKEMGVNPILLGRNRAHQPAYPDGYCEICGDDATRRFTSSFGERCACNRHADMVRAWALEHSGAPTADARLRDAAPDLADAVLGLRRYLRSLEALKAVEGPTIKGWINIASEALKKAGR